MNDVVADSSMATLLIRVHRLGIYAYHGRSCPSFSLSMEISVQNGLVISPRCSMRIFHTCETRPPGGPGTFPAATLVTLARPAALYSPMRPPDTASAPWTAPGPCEAARDTRRLCNVPG